MNSTKAYAEAMQDLYYAYGSEQKSRWRPSTNERSTRLITSREELEYAMNYLYRNDYKYSIAFHNRLARVILALDRWDRDNALKYSRNLLRADEGADDPASFYLAAIAHFRVGLDKKAVEYTNAALEKDPGIVDLYRLRGQYLLEQKDYESAYPDFVKVTELNPKSATGFRGIAKCLGGTNREKASLHLWTKVTTLDTLDHLAFDKVGDLYRDAGNFKKAATAYRKSIDIAADDESFYQLAVCEYMLGAYDVALEECGKVGDYFHTNSTKINNLMGLIHLDSGESVKAMEYFNKAVLIDDQFSNGYFNRARVHIKEERWEMAIEDLNLSIELDVQNSFAYLERGKIKMKIGDSSGCEDILKAAAMGLTVDAGLLTSCE